MTTISADYAMAGGAYPITVEVDPPAPQSRVSVFFRMLFAIPALIVVSIIGLVAFILMVVAWFAILVTGSMPAGLGNFIAKAVVWGTRVNGYFYLLTDKYPPFSGDANSAYPIRVSVVPQLEGRNRVTVFFRTLLVIPHYLIIYVLGSVVGVVGLIAWFAALFTGSVPEGLHNLIAGYIRWSARFYGYFALVTDEYPPFSLS